MGDSRPDRSAPARVQRLISQDISFQRIPDLRQALSEIQEALAQHEDFRWAMESQGFSVIFRVEKLSDALGQTQLMMGDVDLAAEAQKRPEAVAKLLDSPQEVQICITIDVQAIENPALATIAIAHEVAVHLLPRLRMIRVIVERGSVTELELLEFIMSIHGEHTSMIPGDDDSPPPNTLYRDLVGTLIENASNDRTRKQIGLIYMIDVTNHMPGGALDESTKLNVPLLASAARLKQLKEAQSKEEQSKEEQQQENSAPDTPHPREDDQKKQVAADTTDHEFYQFASWSLGLIAGLLSWWRFDGE